MNARDIYNLKLNFPSSDNLLLKIKQPKLITDINYYDVLGLAKDASEDEIRRAYRRLALVWHPDRSTLADAADKFKLLNQAYSVLIDSSKRANYDFDNLALHKPVMRLSDGVLQAVYDFEYTRLKNQLTFLALEPIADIPRDSLIILDEYAFDVNELLAYANSDILSLNYNPHLTKRGQREFSSTAKAKMLEHPLLHSFVVRLNKALADQLKTISRETVNHVITMLLAIDNALSSEDLSQEERLDKADKARVEFVNYTDQLTKHQQTLLNDFIIKVDIIGGGMQSMTFKYALKGGCDDCIKTLQIYCWQFVVTCDHQAISLVPANVHLLARSQGSLIRVPLSNNSNNQSPSPANHQNLPGDQRWRRFSLFFSAEIPMPNQAMDPALRLLEYHQQRNRILAQPNFSNMQRQELLQELLSQALQVQRSLLEEAMMLVIRVDSVPEPSMQRWIRDARQWQRMQEQMNPLPELSLDETDYTDPESDQSSSSDDDSGQHPALDDNPVQSVQRPMILFVEPEDDLDLAAVARMFQPSNNNFQQQEQPQPEPMSPPISIGMQITPQAIFDIPAGTVVAEYIDQSAEQQQQRDRALSLTLQRISVRISQTFFSLHQPPGNPNQDQTQDQNQRRFN